MRLFRLLVPAFVVGLAACSGAEQGLVGPSPARGGTDRPMRGTCETHYELSDFVFLPPPEDDVLVSVRAAHRGTCQLAHLGRSTVTLNEMVTFGSAILGTATGTITAADGDEIFITEAVEILEFEQNGDFPLVGSWTITGGTGRFVGASGRLDFTGRGSTVSNTTQRDLHGSISY
jgi:hypothetical protein